eukprot:3086103-Amphidinium_carterae.1
MPVSVNRKWVPAAVRNSHIVYTFKELNHVSQSMAACAEKRGWLRFGAVKIQSDALLHYGVPRP